MVECPDKRCREVMEKIKFFCMFVEGKGCLFLKDLKKWEEKEHA